MNFNINPEGPFKVYMLNEAGKLKASTLAMGFDQLLTLVLAQCRPDPNFIRPTEANSEGYPYYPAVNTEELRQFIFKLQEASFYAKRAMAMLPENQQ